MKIFDTFMYFNEDLILDIRLNELNEFIDKFVIVESNFTHSGEKKKLNFDIKKFSKFSDKIIYVVSNDKPKNYMEVHNDDSANEKQRKKVINAINLDNHQRNKISEGLVDASKNDLILVSDIDEIPNFQSVNLEKISSKIIVFNQYFFHYKLNLYLKSLNFYGTKACLKKHFKSPQWLRNIKGKKYNKFRIDILFSNKKYNNIHFIDDGGWHFTNIMNEEQLIYKLQSYAHHAEFPKDNLNKEFLKNLINERKMIYDHTADKSADKYSKKINLDVFNLEYLPNYIKNNKEKFSEWLI